MSNILFNVAAFWIEFLKVLLASAFLLKIDRGKKIKVIIGLCISTILAGGISIYYNLYDFSFLYVLAVSIIIFGNISEKKKMGLICLLYIGISIADMIIGAFIMTVFHIDSNMLVENNWLFIPVNSISLVIIIVICIITYYKKPNKRANVYVSKNYAILLITGGICLGLYISIIQVIGFDKLQSRQSNLVTLVISIISIIFVIVASLLIIKENKNKQLTREAEVNNRLLEIQRDYYTMLLQKDEETRKFRHDIQNHFYCMGTLLKDREYDELERYLSNLNMNIARLKCEIYTGNRLVNAIANNLQTKYPNVKINWNGKLPNNITLTAMDLCTIFSNLLSNAFEAAYKAEDKWVEVSVKILETQLLITVLNKASEEPHIINGEFVSSKKETNHGYGVKNVRRCVEENNGTLNIKFEDNIFTAEVFFYNILT